MPEIEVFSKLRGVGAVSQRMERFGFGKLPQHFTIYYTLKHLLKGNPDLNVCVTIKRRKKPTFKEKHYPHASGRRLASCLLQFVSQLSEPGSESIL